MPALDSRLRTALVAQGIHVDATIELDTLNGVIAMVASGFGVSVIPRSTGMLAENVQVRFLPFGPPTVSRRIGLLQRVPDPRGTLVHTLLVALRTSVADLQQGLTSSG
jgi:DNA-binding transcriptional LysR family regulator